MTTSKVSLFKSFYRSQIGSFMATMCDMSSLYLLTELVGIYYVISAGIASGIGAVVGFTILRYWAFERADAKLTGQAFKYGLVSLLILLCNMGGIYLFTDFFEFQYMISKLFVSFFIGIFISFPLFRYYVYR